MVGLTPLHSPTRRLGLPCPVWYPCFQEPFPVTSLRQNSCDDPNAGQVCAGPFMLLAAVICTCSQCMFPLN